MLSSAKHLYNLVTVLLLLLLAEVDGGCDGDSGDCDVDILFPSFIQERKNKRGSPCANCVSRYVSVSVPFDVAMKK